MEEDKRDVKQEKNVSVQMIEHIETKDEKPEISMEATIDTGQKINKKNRSLIIIIISITIFILLGIFSTIFAIINLKNNNILEGVKIADIDVSRMSKEKAQKVLEEIYSKKEENEIYLKSGEFEATTTYKALEVKYKIDEAVEQAYKIGRDGNLLRDNFSIIKAKIKGIQIELEATMDKDMFSQVVENINNSIDGGVKQPDYYQEGDKLIITKGKAGYVVEEEKLKEEMYKVVKKGMQAQTIELQLMTIEPEEIDIDKIHQDIYKEVKDAYYTKNPFTIHPEVEGIDFDLEKAKALLAEEKEQYEIPLIIVKPSKRTKDIGTEAFPDLLSSFSTKYQASNVNRTTNLKLAAKKINGTVLLPGKEFSYNKTVGERTPAAGFKEAAVFNAGRVENGIGGGICQISSTLYDAVVMADLDVTVRRNHQFVTSYVKAGADATVVWGAQDFKFKNSRKNPIRITATVEGGTATIQIWGVKEEVEYDIAIETKKTATIKYTTQYIQDAKLPAGQQKVVQEGNNGRKVEAYKVKKLNGQVVSKTLLSKDTYNAMKKIVHIGTGQ